MLKLHYYIFLVLFTCLIACGGGGQDTATQEEGETSTDAVADAEAVEEATSEPEEEAPNTDFMLGSWKIISYESPETVEFLTRSDPNGDLPFAMENEMYTTSYLELIIDNTYRLFNTADFGYDEEGNIDKGEWTISEDMKSMTLTRQDLEDWVFEVVELSPEKMVLTFQNRIPTEDGEGEDNFFPVTMTLEPMGE